MVIQKTSLYNGLPKQRLEHNRLRPSCPSCATTLAPGLPCFMGATAHGVSARPWKKVRPQQWGLRHAFVVQKCPFDAIMIINLPKNLDKETTHRYGPNSFKLHRCAPPHAPQGSECRPTSRARQSKALRRPFNPTYIRQYQEFLRCVPTGLWVTCMRPLVSQWSSRLPAPGFPTGRFPGLRSMDICASVAQGRQWGRLLAKRLAVCLVLGE